MTQMPRFDSQVSAERMRTRSRPESSIFCASSSLISVLACTMISPVNGSRMSSAATRPSTRSRRDWMMSPPSTRVGVDVFHGAAVVLRHDDVLGHVDEAAGKVARVRRLEGGIGQALAGAVGGGEVLQHGEAFAEVRGDGRFDDLTRGLGHEAAHARELADLLLGA